MMKTLVVKGFNLITGPDILLFKIYEDVGEGCLGKQAVVSVDLKKNKT